MDANTIHDLRRAHQAAREFTLPLSAQDVPRTVTLRTPTDHELRLASLRAGLGREKRDAAALALLERALLCTSIIGWAGLCMSDIAVPETQAATDASPLEFDAQLVDVLLDAHPEWFAGAVEAIYARLQQRREQQAAAEKN